MGFNNSKQPKPFKKNLLTTVNKVDSMWNMDLSFVTANEVI